MCWHRPFLRDLLHDRVGAEPVVLGDLEEVFVDLDHRLGVLAFLQDVAVEHQAEEGLDAAGAIRQHADRPRRGDRGGRGVSHRTIVLGVPDAALPVREIAARPGQTFGGLVAAVVDELHHVLRERPRPGRCYRECPA